MSRPIRKQISFSVVDLEEIENDLESFLEKHDIKLKQEEEHESNY